jgi:fumarate hydratase class II
LEADVERCQGNIELSLAMCTALAQVVGYDKAAEIAKVAYETGRTVRDVSMDVTGFDKARLDQLLNPSNQSGSKPG